MGNPSWKIVPPGRSYACGPFQNGAGLFKKQYGLSKNVSTSVQAIPLGMGDAIFGAYDHWKNFDHILIIWGDQVNVSSQTLQAVIQSQKASCEKTLTIAINMVSGPYVQYDFNQDRSTLMNIRQTREGDTCDKNGFADVGAFCLSTSTLLKSWHEYAKRPSLGKHTGELNFLPVLVYLSKGRTMEIKSCRNQRSFRVQRDKHARRLRIF